MKKIFIFLLLSVQLYAQKCKDTLLERKGFEVCYSDSLGHPTFVKWDLKESDFGTVERQNDFRPDKQLPKGFYTVTPTNYARSGFDKGHVCNSADRTSSLDENQETFLMSNMIPQSPNCNRITWEHLEQHCRDLVKQGYEINIIAGAYGTGGDGEHGHADKIANRINVPSNFWKIVKVSKDTIVNYIIVDMPNSQDIKPDWNKYLSNRAELELKTGLDFSDFFE